jgi:5-bromo-4-chloroindolyl phosphate hydrolysis protein
VTQQTNIADQIGAAVQDALDHQDFSKIQDMVWQGLGTAAKGIGDGISTAANTTRQMYEDYQRGQAERQRFEEQQRELARVSSTRYADVQGTRFGGFAMAIVGGLAAVGLGIVSIGTLVVSLVTSAASVGISCAVAAAGAAAFAGMTVAGVKRVGLTSRFAKYRNNIGTAERYPIGELARRTGKNSKAVKKDLNTMVDKGMFLQGHVDEKTETLFLTDASYNAFERDKQQAAERQYREQLRQQAARQRSHARAITEDEKKTLAEGRGLLRDIDVRRPDVGSAKVAAQAQQICAMVGTIFNRAEQDPDTISKLQQTVDYYLPLTIKLLDTYTELAAQPLQSESITASRTEIENTLDTLIRAFAKLHDSLFRDITWDISTDISVLNTVLAQDGLVDDPFEKKAGGSHE